MKVVRVDDFTPQQLLNEAAETVKSTPPSSAARARSVGKKIAAKKTAKKAVKKKSSIKKAVNKKAINKKAVVKK